MAVGRLAQRRIPDHREAKGAARRITQRLMQEFAEEFGSTGCRELTGYDMTTEHEAFIESGVWKDICMRQIDFAVTRLAPLADPARWAAELQDLEAGPAEPEGT